jgi:archaellum component FlaG (FlaF/FlaG flagellin family)
MEPSIFYWKTGGWDDVNGSRLVADSELVAQIRGALKIVRAPGRLALSKNMGNGNGTAWISSIENQSPAIENDNVQRRSETKIQTENYQSALTWGGSDE